MIRLNNEEAHAAFREASRQEQVWAHGAQTATSPTLYRSARQWRLHWQSVMARAASMHDPAQCGHCYGGA